MRGFRIWRRHIAAGLIPALLLLTGCGGMKTLEKDDLLQPDEAKSFRVTTWDGEQYTFIALHLEGDVLMGTERITTTTTIGEGEEAREAVSNRYVERSIPWSEVEKVEAEKSGVRRGGAWLVLGSVALGVAAFLIISQSGGDDTPSDGGGGKPPPGS